MMSAASANADEGCTQTSAPIETDRPDVTNSSVVIPLGSFQNENGINFSRSNGGHGVSSTFGEDRLGSRSQHHLFSQWQGFSVAFRAKR